MSKLLSKLSKVSRSLSKGESLLELVLGTAEVSENINILLFRILLTIFYLFTSPLLRCRGGKMASLLQTLSLLLAVPPGVVCRLPQVDVLPLPVLLGLPERQELADRPLLQSAHRVPQLGLVNLLDPGLDQDQSPARCNMSSVLRKTNKSTSGLR